MPLNKLWREMKDFVLGQDFDLSVVFADDTLMKKLNTDYRKKEGSTDVLSFSLSKDSGEIFLNKNLRKIKNKKHLDFLFAHSLLHIKGYDHNAKMEKEEDKLIKKFNIKFDPSY